MHKPTALLERVGDERQRDAVLPHGVHTLPQSCAVIYIYAQPSLSDTPQIYVGTDSGYLVQRGLCVQWVDALSLALAHRVIALHIELCPESVADLFSHAPPCKIRHMFTVCILHGVACVFRRSSLQDTPYDTVCAYLIGGV